MTFDASSSSAGGGDGAPPARDVPDEVPSASEFRDLIRRTDRMQDRIDELERGAEAEAKGGGEGAALIATNPSATDLFHDARDKASGEDFADDAKGEGNGGGALTESQVEAKYDDYEFPESTYTFMTTEKIISIPFVAAVITSAFAFLCLILAFQNEWDNGDEGNPLGIPAGVQRTVKIAQYAGIIIGVLMEQEIPQGLELIGKAVEQDIAGVNRFSIPRIVLPSLLRMATGYLFLLCMFLTVMQESTVLDIFFDILALEFIESIDDVIYELSKRGFLGRKLRVAANNEHHIECSAQSHGSRKWTKRFIRFIYLFNVALGIGALAYFSHQQQQGAYRCNSVTVSFGDAIWEDAYIVNGDGTTEKRLLLLSHFNGVYVETKPDINRKPRYVERNKEDGDEFAKTIPAEIVYCEDIEAWVFRHPNILTSDTYDEVDDENECSWLLRSPNTESFDLTELAEEEEWFVWQGLVESDYRISIECNECGGKDDCNYNGECKEDEIGVSTCKCSQNFFGSHCQFEQPCAVIRSEKDTAATLNLLGDPNDEEGEDFVEVYGRPLYVRRNMAGSPLSFLRLGYPDDGAEHFEIEYPNSTSPNDGQAVTPHKHNAPEFFTDDDFMEQNNRTAEYAALLQNYTFVVFYTGRRWYGQIIAPGLSATAFDEQEYHAFWANTFSGQGEQDNRTVIISAPTGGGSPVGVDFYEMRRRNIALETGEFDYNYGPFGVLIPVTEYEGTGFFHCNRAG